MSQSETLTLRDELARRVQDRTGRRIRNLTIDLCDERVILRGQAVSYYVKQLAQHGVRDLLPDVRLENTIVVENQPTPAERAAG